VISKSCKYGIQALTLIASPNPNAMCDFNRYVLAKQISSTLSIPKEYLHKVLGVLAREGLVKSLKGPQGGFCLARKPKDITLFDIVKAIDGTDMFRKCILRSEECDETNPCALHPYWRKILSQTRTLLDYVTIEDLVNDFKDGKRVLQLSDDRFGITEIQKIIGFNIKTKM